MRWFGGRGIGPSDGFGRGADGFFTVLLGFELDFRDLANSRGQLGVIQRLREPQALKMWLTSIALFKARRVLRHRKRRNWLRLTPPEELCNLAVVSGSSELAESMRCTYLVLNELPTDERIAFALRFVDGMELSEIADACRSSIATIKRRLRRAEGRFLRKARRYPVLSARIAGGGRFTP